MVKSGTLQENVLNSEAERYTQKCDIETHHIFLEISRLHENFRRSTIF